MKKIFLLSIFLIMAARAATAQSQKLNGVYVGAQLYTDPFQGMQIENIVICFRPDGTFTNKLNTPSWRTDVSGTYTINNGFVQLTFRDGAERKKYKLSQNGNLQSTAGINHTLHKVNKVTALPAASFERRTASGSGGMGTGMPNVFAGSSGYLAFDGKGNFSLDRSSIVGIGGDVTGGTIGGKSENNEKKGGTYKLGDGEITLTFNDGTVTKHSLFYSPPGEEDMVVLDGDFYFREEDENKKEETRSETNKRAEEKNAPAATNGLPSTTELLSKLRARYGGESIDKLTTVRERSTVNGSLQIVSLYDVTNNKLRAEMWQQGKLLLVKQVEGDEGWQWMKGVKKPLSQEEKEEMQIGIYQGVVGLHNKLNNYFRQGTVTTSTGDYLVTFYINDNKLVYLIGSDFTLKGSAYTIHQGDPKMSVYKNFTHKNGITYPGTTEFRDGQTTITGNATSIEFNPVFTAADWKTP